MLKRARTSMEVALIAWVFGFTGLTEGAAPIAQFAFYCALFMCILSLLFALFEDEDNTAGETRQRHRGIDSRPAG